MTALELGLQQDLSALLSAIEVSKGQKIEHDAAAENSRVARVQAVIDLNQVLDESSKAKTVFIEQSEYHKNQIILLEDQIKTKQLALDLLIEDHVNKKEQSQFEIAQLKEDINILKAAKQLASDASTTLDGQIEQKQILNTELGTQIASSKDILDGINQKIVIAQEVLEQTQLDTSLNLAKQADLGERERSIQETELRQKRAWQDIKIMQQRLEPEYQKVFADLLKQNS